MTARLAFDGGFQDESIESARAFRLILDALARCELQVTSYKKTKLQGTSHEGQQIHPRSARPMRAAVSLAGVTCRWQHVTCDFDG